MKYTNACIFGWYIRSYMVGVIRAAKGRWFLLRNSESFSLGGVCVHAWAMFWAVVVGPCSGVLRRICVFPRAPMHLNDMMMTDGELCGRLSVGPTPVLLGCTVST